MMIEVLDRLGPGETKGHAATNAVYRRLVAVWYACDAIETGSAPAKAVDLLYAVAADLREAEGMIRQRVKREVQVELPTRAAEVV